MLFDKTFFFLKTLDTFLLSKKIFGWKVNFSKNAAPKFMTWAKKAKKILFFFSRPEKKGLIMYFFQIILCVIWKFAEVLPKFFLVRSTIFDNFMKYSWGGGGKNPMFLPPPPIFPEPWFHSKCRKTKMNFLSTISLYNSWKCLFGNLIQLLSN